MNTEFYIASRLTFDKESKKALSRPILKISVIGLALSLSVMIISVATVTGFKGAIRQKIIGFGSHIQIINYDSNNSYKTVPISKRQPFLPLIDSLPGIKHVQVFATTPGIIKTRSDIEGAIVKGIGSDFDWSFFSDNLVEGKIFHVNDSVKTDKALISKYLANLLKLKVGDRFAMYFIGDKVSGRAFEISGIYETSLVDFDKQFILADIGHVQSINGWTSDQISGYEILIDNYDDINRMEREVYNIAGVTINDEGSKLRVVSIRDRYPQIFDWLGLLDWNVWVLLTIILLVSIFNMISGLLIIILDRINMIGILKALGMRNKSVRRIFLYQAVYLMIRGLFWGNIIGIGLCWLEYHFKFLKLNQESYLLSFVPVNFNFIHILLLNIGTLLIITVVLILPSMVVAKISPAKSIRFD